MYPTIRKIAVLCTSVWNTSSPTFPLVHRARAEKHANGKKNGHAKATCRVQIRGESLLPPVFARQFPVSI